MDQKSSASQLHACSSCHPWQVLPSPWLPLIAQKLNQQKEKKKKKKKPLNIKSHPWLQEPGNFPPAEAILYEKELEMRFFFVIN